METFLDITTTSTQAVPAEYARERVFKEYFVAKNHNRDKCRKFYLLCQGGKVKFLNYSH